VRHQAARQCRRSPPAQLRRGLGGEAPDASFAVDSDWAADDLRSVNGQVEFLLRRVLHDAGRLPAREHDGGRQARDAIPGRVVEATAGDTTRDGPGIT